MALHKKIIIKEIRNACYWKGNLKLTSYCPQKSLQTSSYRGWYKELVRYIEDIVLLEGVHKFKLIVFLRAWVFTIWIWASSSEIIIWKISAIDILWDSSSLPVQCKLQEACERDKLTCTCFVSWPSNLEQVQLASFQSST